MSSSGDDPTQHDVPVVDDATFMRNVKDGIENGYDRCCAWCGTGVFDGMEMHDRACPMNPTDIPLTGGRPRTTVERDGP